MATIAGVSAPHPGQQQQQYRGPPPLGPFNPNKLHSDPERFICIYPAYMNKVKSISEGRRIPKEKAVENPNYQEIKMVLDELGYQMGSNYVMEGKFYSREKSKEPMFRGEFFTFIIQHFISASVGRFKIQLKQADGELFKEEFPTRESLMEHIASKIPQLKHRVRTYKSKIRIHILNR